MRLDLEDFSGMDEDVPREAQRFCSAFAMVPGSESKVCKVDGCNREMTYEKAYYRRYTVCEAHLRALQLVVDGRVQRFCQQCAKFQPIEEFDDDRRSCRTQLVKHKLRRRHKLMQQREMRRREAQRDADSATYGVGIGGGDGAASSGSGEELPLPLHPQQSQRSTSVSPVVSPPTHNLPTIRGNSSSPRTTSITGRARALDDNFRPPVARVPSDPGMMFRGGSTPSLDGMGQQFPAAHLDRELPGPQAGQQVAMRRTFSGGDFGDTPWQQSRALWPPADNAPLLQRPLSDGGAYYRSVSIANAMQQEQAQYSQLQEQQQPQLQLQQGPYEHRSSRRSTQSHLSVPELLQRTNHSPMKISSNGTSRVTLSQRPDRLLQPVSRRPSMLQPDGDLDSPMGSPCSSPRPVSSAPEELPPNLSLNSWWLQPFASDADYRMRTATAVSKDGRAAPAAQPPVQGMLADLAAGGMAACANANSQPGGRSFQPPRLHPLPEAPSPTVPPGGYVTAAAAAAPPPLAGQPQHQQPYPPPLTTMPTLVAAPPPSHPPPSRAQDQPPEGWAPMQESPFRNPRDEGEPGRAAAGGLLPMRQSDAHDLWMDVVLGLEMIDSLTANFDLPGPQAAATVHGMTPLSAGGSGACPGGGAVAPFRFASAPGIICTGPSAGSGPSAGGAGAEPPGTCPGSGVPQASNGARPAQATEPRTTTSQASAPSSASGSGNASAFRSGSGSGSASSGVDWRAAAQVNMEKTLSAPSAATATTEATSWCKRLLDGVDDACFYLDAPSQPSQSRKRPPPESYNAPPIYGVLFASGEGPRDASTATRMPLGGYGLSEPQLLGQTGSMVDGEPSLRTELRQFLQECRQQEQQQQGLQRQEQRTEDDDRPQQPQLSDEPNWQMEAEESWLQPWQPPPPPPQRPQQVRPVASTASVQQPEAMTPPLPHGEPPVQQLTGQQPQPQPQPQVNWQDGHFQEESQSRQGAPVQPQDPPRQLPQQQLDGGQLLPPSVPVTPVPSAAQQACIAQGNAVFADVAVAGDGAGGQPSAAAAASAASGALGSGEMPYIPNSDQAPTAAATGDQVMRRFSMKLYGVSPEDLQPDAFARLQAWVSLMDMRMMDMMVRAGCVQIIANVVTAPAGCGRAAAGYGSGRITSSGGAAANTGLCIRDAETPGLLGSAAEAPLAPARAMSSLPAFSLAVDSPTPAAELSSPQQGDRLGLHGSGFGDSDGGALVWVLLRLLFDSRVSKLGCEGLDGKRKHLVLQLDGQVACWSLSRKRPRLDELSGKAISRDAGKGGRVPPKVADGPSSPPSNHVSSSLDILHGTPVAVELPPSPVVVAVRPVAVVAAQPDKQLEVTLRVPAGAGDACNAKTAAGPSTSLQLRFKGDTLANCNLTDLLPSGSPPSQRGAAVASIVDSAASISNTITATTSTTTTSGSHSVATTITVAMPLPALTSPGMAVVETSCGDVLGPWLPLLVVPSEGVARELEGLVGRLTEGGGGAARPPAHQLRRFLCDLGRLLPLLDGTDGACSRRKCVAPNGKSYVSYMAQPYGVPEAADVASRVLGRCVEWNMPECGSLVSRLLAL